MADPAGHGRNDAAADLARIRKGDNDQRDVPGYLEDGIEPRAQVGDERGPFLVIPPNSTDRQLIFEIDVLPTADYGVSSEFDVGPVRDLTLWLDYTAGEAGEQLSLIPQVRQRDVDDWFSIGVVDATVAANNALPNQSCTFGSRTIYPAEFATTVANGTERCLYTLNFDVAPYKQMRFLIAALNDPAAPGSARGHVSLND